MTKYFSSDHHVFHENILNLGTGRPFNSISHMHSVLRERHNAVVAPDDDVYFLGDIALGNFEQSILFFLELNGNKFLVTGNHDKIFSGTNSKKRIETFTPLYEAVGFTILPEITSIFIDNQEVVLSHFPYRGDHEREEKFNKNRPVNKGLPLLNGHTHYRNRFDVNEPLAMHVGVDANNFTPVSEIEVIEWINQLRDKKLI